MGEYADYDFAQMRSDAVRRVEEMKKRAQTYLERENAPQSAAAHPPAPQAAGSAPPVPEKAAKAQESDTFILLLLILLLSREGADQSLLFALLYMLL